MRVTVASVLLGCAVVAGSAGLAAPTQSRPGEPTQAKVWVQNHGRSEAVPISLQEIAIDAPIRVQISGTPGVAITAPTVFDARQLRQTWEYHKISMAPDDDPTPELMRLGRDGWETALQWASARGVTIILKRPAAVGR